MANNDNRQQNDQKKKPYNPNQYEPKELLNGLGELNAKLNKIGDVFKEKASALQVKLVDMIAVTYGITEIDHIYVKAKFDRNGKLVTVLCRAYFNTTNITEGNIVRRGYGTAASTDGAQTIIPFTSGLTSGEGDFDTTPRFREVIAPLSLSDDGKLHIGTATTNKNVACIDIDFFAAMALLLNIGAEDPYNFTILTAEPINRGDDSVLMFSKFIDVAGSSKRGRHYKTSKVDYNALDREWANEDSRYAGGGNRRSF